MIVNLFLFLNFNILNKKHNLIRNSKLNIIFEKMIKGGYDEKFNSTLVEDNEILNKIRNYNAKYETLKYLKNDKHSLINKINYLELCDLEFLQKKIVPNITFGGLFKDWDFDF
jgi:hypothetical protein